MNYKNTLAGYKLLFKGISAWYLGHLLLTTFFIIANYGGLSKVMSVVSIVSILWIFFFPAINLFLFVGWAYFGSELSKYSNQDKVKYLKLFLIVGFCLNILLGALRWITVTELIIMVIIIAYSFFTIEKFFSTSDKESGEVTRTTKIFGIIWIFYALYSGLTGTTILPQDKYTVAMSTWSWSTYADQNSGIAFKYPSSFTILSDHGNTQQTKGSKDITMVNGPFLYTNTQTPGKDIIYVLRFTVSVDGSKHINPESGFYKCSYERKSPFGCIYNDSSVRVTDYSGFPTSFIKIAPNTAQIFLDTLKVQEIYSFLKDNNIPMPVEGTANWVRYRDSNLHFSLRYPPEWEIGNAGYSVSGGPIVKMFIGSPINKTIIPGKDVEYVLEIGVNERGEKLIKTSGFYLTLPFGDRLTSGELIKSSGIKTATRGGESVDIAQDLVKSTTEYEIAQKIFDSFEINQSNKGENTVTPPTKKGVNYPY